MLDPLDRKILSVLQGNAKTSLLEMGRAVHLSPLAVSRRILSMEEDGVISGYAVVFDPAKVGRPLTFIVEVSLVSETPDMLEIVPQRLVDCDATNQVYYATGEIDFVLLLTVSDMTEYEEICQKLFFDGGDINRFQTFVAMQRVKSTWLFPLDTTKSAAQTPVNSKYLASDKHRY